MVRLYFVINQHNPNWLHRYWTYEVNQDKVSRFGFPNIVHNALIDSDVVIAVEAGKMRYYKNRFKSHKSKVDLDEFTLIRLSSIDL